RTIMFCLYIFGICGTHYPLSIAFIVVNEFCERFSYYGMKAVLSLYFLYFLHWDETTSTSVYHAFSSLCYFSPVIGAFIADSWLGKYKTIIYLSIVYVIGHVIKSVGAITSVGNHIAHVILSMTGLSLIALGTGGIKPCVAAFGGDQFEEKHVQERNKFFSVFYLAINAGSLISTILTPVLRGGVQCFGGDCYALAFGVPAALMIVALVVFISGNRLYKKTPPQGNILLEVCKCIVFALRNRIRNRSPEIPKREHWLDWASEKYSNQLITEVKMVTRVLFLFIPLPMFWALFEQQVMNTNSKKYFTIPTSSDFKTQKLGISYYAVPQYQCWDSNFFTTGSVAVAWWTWQGKDTVKSPVRDGICRFSKLLKISTTGSPELASTEELQAWKIEDIPANNVHISWQIPQYLLMSAGEVMFSISGLAFSYSQAPVSMKSVLQAGWLLTVAFGNMIVLIVAQSAPLVQWAEFILFAMLLFIVFVIFSIMGYFYISTDPEELADKGNEHETSSNKNMIGLVTRKTKL
uniref:Solute carrier family 15 member 2 n=1 Tax=Pseudonaja textilis TaxID=8673 RepID=A0A670YH42_PSETE